MLSLEKVPASVATKCPADLAFEARIDQYHENLARSIRTISHFDNEWTAGRRVRLCLDLLTGYVSLATSAPGGYLTGLELEVRAGRVAALDLPDGTPAGVACQLLDAYRDELVHLFAWCVRLRGTSQMHLSAGGHMKLCRIRESARYIQDPSFKPLF